MPLSSMTMHEMMMRVGRFPALVVVLAACLPVQTGVRRQVSSPVCLPGVRGLGACVGSCAAAASAETGAKKKAVVLRLGSVAPAASTWGRLALEYEKDIEKTAKGRLEIELRLGGVLGTESEMLQMVLDGELEGAAVTSSAIAKLLPEMQILELPFLFEDTEEARYLIDRVIAPRLVRRLAEKDIFGTAIFENGFRCFVAGRHIRSPEDLKGLKFASEESDVHAAFWRSLGAKPVPMPVADVPAAFGKGSVGGADNSILGILAFNLHTKKKYITVSNHIFQAAMIVINNGWWESLPQDLQLMMLKQNTRLAEGMREATIKAADDAANALEKSGVRFHTLTAKEKEAFIAKTNAVYGEFESVVGKRLLEDVLKARAEYRARNTRGQ
ncbi:MAG: TRAP transporter substrate-binding protein [bacterium]